MADETGIISAELLQAMVPGDFRHNIMVMQEALAKQPGAWTGDTEKCPLRHLFGDGIYVREIFIPKGTLLIGKIHKYAHPRFILQGLVVVATEADGLQTVAAPFVMITQPGTKRFVYALEDTWIATVHATTSRDIPTIEAEIIAPSFAAFEAFQRQEEQP